STVPMAITSEEITEIDREMERTGLIYMMGETSFYTPAVVWAREKVAAGELGRVFYSEGDYVHDMDNGFYAAYRYSGGDDWKSTASFPTRTPTPSRSPSSGSTARSSGPRPASPRSRRRARSSTRSSPGSTTGRARSASCSTTPRSTTTSTRPRRT